MSTIERTQEPDPYWGIGQNRDALFHVVVAHRAPSRWRQQGACGVWFLQADAPFTTPPASFRCKSCERYAITHDVRGRGDRHDEFDWNRGR